MRARYAAKHEFEQERARSEALLHDILPSQVAQELKTSGHVRARYHPPVTVLFTDFHDSVLAAGELLPRRHVDVR
jgi:adenylate cyclase